MLPFWYRRAVPVALVVAVALPVAARGQGIQAHIPLKTTLAEISALRTSYADAFNAKNVTAINAMYTPDAIEVSSNGAIAVGAGAIAKSNAEGSGQWPHVVILSTTTKVYGSLAIDAGTVTAQPAGGAEVTNRYLVVLRRGINGWKIQNITNVPITK